MIADKRNLFVMRFSSVSHRLVYLFFVHLFLSLLFFCVTVASTVTAGLHLSHKRKEGLEKDEQKVDRQGDEKRY